MKGVLTASSLVLAGCAHWSEELAGPTVLTSSPFKTAPVSEGIFNCVELCIESAQPFRTPPTGADALVLYRDGSTKHHRFEKVYLNTPRACSLLGEELTDQAVEVHITAEPTLEATRIYWYWHYEH